MPRFLLLCAVVIVSGIAGCGEDAPPKGDAPLAPTPIAAAPAPLPFTPEQAEAVHRKTVLGEAAFAGERERALVARLAPDGTSVWTAGLDRVLRRYDLEGRLLESRSGHRASIHEITFAPGGTWLVTSSVDETARLWRADTDEAVPLVGHHAEIVSARFVRGGDDPRIATLSMDGSARLWRADGRRIARIETDHAAVEGVVVSPRGDRWLTLAPDAGTRLWDADGEAVATLEARAAEAEGACFSPTGDRILVWGPWNEAYILDADGRALATLAGHAAEVRDAAFTPDGARLVTASLDATARIWTMKGELVAALEGHRSPLFEVETSFDGTHVLTASSDRSLRLWSIDGEAMATLGGDTAPLVGGSFSPDGTRILALPFERGMAKIFDLQGRLRQVLPDDSGRTLSAAWTPDGRQVLTLDRDLVPHVFDVEASSMAARLTPDLAPPIPGTPPEGPRRGDYAGTVACAPCHREAHEAWRDSSHAKTSTWASPMDLPSAVAAGETVVHAPSWTRFFAEGDRYFAETVGEDGKPQSFELTDVAGHLRIRFFVTTLEDGRMQVLPAMLDLPNEAWFDYTHLIYGADPKAPMTPPIVNPGDASFWTGPVRSWDRGCAHCHMSGRQAIQPGPDGKGPRSVWRAYAVDCEACHGPGRLHAEAWTRMEMDQTLPRLEALTLKTRTELCTRCHQEGEVLSPPYALDKDLYEYIDPTLVISPERADPAGRALELIYDGLPFGTSHCANHGGLTCSTCHAPHGSDAVSLLRHEPEDGSFCLPCHKEYVEDPGTHSHHDAKGVGAQCIPCHMPFLTIERGHGSVADHTIGIPRPGLEGDRVQPDACTWCHQEGRQAPFDVPTLTDTEIRESYDAWWPGRGWPRSWMTALADARLGKADAWKALVETIGTSDHPREARASAALLLGRYPNQVEAILDATRDEDSLVRRSAIKSLARVEGEQADQRLFEALADPQWSVRVAAARTALSGWTRVTKNKTLLRQILPVLREDAARVPDDDQRWFRLGAACDLLGDEVGALEAYERVLPLDPFAHAVRRHVENLRTKLVR